MEIYPIKIAIIHSYKIIRKALKGSLAQFPNLKIVTDTAFSKELSIMLPDDSVQVLLTELAPDISGYKEYLQVLKFNYPNAKMLILSITDDPQLISQLIDFGVFGYLSYDSDINDIIEAIKMVNAGYIYRNRVYTEALYLKTSRMINSSIQNDNFFTDKHKKILQLLWQEKSTQEIATEVFLSISAIDKIKQQMKDKIGAKTTIGLLKYAVEKNLI
ncbi:response regulator transcription factor [Chitinophaga sp.]|uniref:response regulator transcription factor n=1 Tax=Chitinophaga sp. TaxID=1869181 RepID=UPI0031DF2C04